MIRFDSHQFFRLFPVLLLLYRRSREIPAAVEAVPKMIAMTGTPPTVLVSDSPLVANQSSDPITTMATPKGEPSSILVGVVGVVVADLVISLSFFLFLLLFLEEEEEEADRNGLVVVPSEPFLTTCKPILAKLNLRIRPGPVVGMKESLIVIRHSRSDNPSRADNRCIMASLTGERVEDFVWWYSTARSTMQSR
jgi:hypothetical protein